MEVYKRVALMDRRSEIENQLREQAVRASAAEDDEDDSVRSDDYDINNEAPIDPQTQSPLFRLPAEIRNRIYDYVFGSGTIHRAWRPCTENENYTRSYDNHQHFASWQGPRDRAFAKLTYTICKTPHDWASQYYESKWEAHDEENIARKHADTCVADFIHVMGLISLSRHLSDMMDRGDEHIKADSKSIDDYRLETAKMTWEGLGLGLLQTCRLIRDEAWKLPFVKYTFDIRKNSLIELGTDILYSHQAEAIESIQLDYFYGVEELLDMLRNFPNVKRIRLLAGAWYRLSGKAEAWEEFFSINNLETVEVICQRDSHNRYDQPPNPRARLMERFLVKLGKDEDVSDRLLEYADLLQRL